MGMVARAIDELGQYNDNIGPNLDELNSPGGPFTETNNATFSPDLTLTQNGTTLTYSGTLIDGLPYTQYLVTLDRQ